MAEIDGRPVPKVIDFGLAKALENSERPIEMLGLLIKIAELQNDQADLEKWQAEKEALLSDRPTHLLLADDDK